MFSVVVDGSGGQRTQFKQTHSSKQTVEELMFAAAEGNVKKITWLIKHREIDVSCFFSLKWSL